MPTWKSSAFLPMKESRFKTMLTPGRSPDAMPIENVFVTIKRRLEAVPTRAIEELKSKVTKVWRGLPDAYLEELCTSMRRRCPGIINNNGYPTKYCMFMFPKTYSVIPYFIFLWKRAKSGEKAMKTTIQAD